MKIKPAILRETMVERTGPVILFDNEVIEKNLKRFRAISNENNATWTMAVKALARPEVFDLASEHVDGYDISNINEWNKIKDFVNERHLIWFTNANLTKELPVLRKEVKSEKLLVTVNDHLDYQYIKSSDVPYLIRVASSALTRQDSESRFGMELEAVSRLKNELLNDQNFKGFHTHQGLVDHTPSILKNICQGIEENFKEFFNRGLYYNLGGSFQAFSDDDLRESLNLLKGKFKVHIEPGRAVFKDAGYAMAPIEKFFMDGDQLRIFTRLSFINHLKWSKPRFAGILNFSEELEVISPGSLVFEGPTCYEFDKSEKIILETPVSLTKGSLILLENISGYSSEWNAGFNGVDEAEVKFVGRKRRDTP